MLPVLQIGPLALQFPGLVMLAGVWLGLSLAERYSPRRGIAPNDLYNLVFIALIAGVIGARLTYVAMFPAAFSGNLLSLFSPNLGLFDPLGGLAAGGLAAVIFAQRKRLALWALLDALTPLLAVAFIALALSQLAAGTAFGSETRLPWGIELWGARRHPTQLYMALLAGAALWALWPSRPALQSWPPGRYFLTFLAAAAGIRLFTEAFRGDSTLISGGLRAAQVIAWLALAACLWGISHRMNQPEEEEPLRHEER